MKEPLTVSPYGDVEPPEQGIRLPRQGHTERTTDANEYVFSTEARLAKQSRARGKRDWALP